ncbi:MAG: molybdenum cofactor biosynthesis protein MoaE [Alphaproteobacteria bacterium]|jgi:molybdopterin synthase catalytic subunit|nr:molybdenum cofactor biosynthesis protein MoaE [Alphaproteobacteria bacterium]
MKVFVEGPIQPSVIAEAITKHQTKTDIGAHDIFLGQVRADSIEGKDVTAIEYTAYAEMAQELLSNIKEEMFSQFSISCLHVTHSLGLVKAGEISLFVFVSAPHRQAAFEACRYLVERIKAEAPIWGREIFEDQGYQWKVNA